MCLVAVLEFSAASFCTPTNELESGMSTENPYIDQIETLTETGLQDVDYEYMNELVEHKILRSQKDGVEVYYINDDLLRILEG